MSYLRPIVKFSEQIVERAAISWFRDCDYQLAYGPELSPDAPAAERDDFETVVLVPRLKAALKKINNHLTEDAIEQAVRVVTRPPEPTLN